MKKYPVIVALILTLALTCIPGYAAETNPASGKTDRYTDIAGHWAEKAINIYAEPAIFAVDNSKFLPQQPITRSEFVMMLHKALGISIQYFKATDIGEYFTDVSNDDLYASNLYDLATMNIIDYRGSFRPNQNLPREEMVHFIMNALANRLEGKLPANDILSKRFKDDGQISEQYYSDIYEAFSMSLINGRGGNMFFPKAACTRAEAAIMMQRLVDAIDRLSGNVDIQVSAAKEADRITMNLVIANNTSDSVALDYTSGQRYDFALLDRSKNVLYRWSADKLFIQEVSSVTIGPGESLAYFDELSGDSYNKIKDKICFMTVFITGQSKSFIVNNDGYQIDFE